MIRAIIFDVDGVLLDSFEANFEFFQNLMTRAGYRAPTKDEYLPLFHRTLRDTVQILTGLKSEAEIKRICDLIDVVGNQPPIITAGAPKVIKDLSREYALAVVTSRNKAYAYEPPLNALEPFFKATVAYEDTTRHKPDPEPLLLAASQLGVRPEECVYVGDVENDLTAARAADMKFILYSKEGKDGADGRVSRFKDIPKLIHQL